MADFYRDCWIHAGQVRTVERTTETGMHVRGCLSDTLAWRDHNTDKGFVDGQPLLVPKPDQPGEWVEAPSLMGNFPLAWDELAFLYAQHDTSGRLFAYGTNGLALIVDGQHVFEPAPYASEGIVSIRNESAVMGNDPSLRRVINGETWFNCVETENYIVGQYGRDPDYGGALAKLHKRTSQVTRWLGYTPHPPRAVELDGVLTVCISGRDTPAPGQVEWASDFPPLPQPAPIGITFGEAPKGLTLWMGGTTTDADMPGNVTWSGKKGDFSDPRPALEMAEFAADYIGPRKLAAGLWLTDGGRDPQTIDTEIAFTKARGAKGIAIHCDDFTPQFQNAVTAGQRAIDAGLGRVFLAHAVERVDDFKMARGYFSGFPSEPWGITLNARTVNKNPELMAETVREVMRSLSLPGCTMLLVFGNFATLEKEWPDLARLLRELAANVQTPALYPGQSPAPKPEPQKPTTPVARPKFGQKPSTPKRGKDADKIAPAAVGLAALFVGLWKWIRRA